MFSDANISVPVSGLDFSVGYWPSTFHYGFRRFTGNQLPAFPVDSDIQPLKRTALTVTER